MNWSQGKSELQEQINEVTFQLGLNHPYVVEKDLYVTQAIHTLTEIEDDNYELILQGGTSLAKAHRVIERMSEDCDFRVKLKSPLDSLSKEKKRDSLRAYRRKIISELEYVGFLIDKEHIKVRNEGQYMSLGANFVADFPHQSQLKQHILLEFFLGAVKLPTSTKEVTSLIRQTLGDAIEHPQKQIQCLSITETAAEKWVALTRRVANRRYRENPTDSELVRHIYDLYQINQHHGFDDEFYNLLASIIETDRKEFRNQNKEYSENPKFEIQRALNNLLDDEYWTVSWNNFMSVMVYQQEKPSFKNALDSLNIISLEALSRI